MGGTETGTESGAQSGTERGTESGDQDGTERAVCVNFGIPRRLRVINRVDPTLC